jgi:hypothetical protein
MKELAKRREKVKLEIDKLKKELKEIESELREQLDDLGVKDLLPIERIIIKEVSPAPSINWPNYLPAVPKPYDITFHSGGRVVV